MAIDLGQPQSVAAHRPNRCGRIVAWLGLIRFGGRVDYVDPVSSSFVEESLQGLGGVGISSRRSLVAAGEHPVAI